MPAWRLEEGAELPDGHRVVSLIRTVRDPDDDGRPTVRIATSEPTVSVLPADAVVPVIRGNSNSCCCRC